MWKTCMEEIIFHRDFRVALMFKHDGTMYCCIG